MKKQWLVVVAVAASLASTGAFAQSNGTMGDSGNGPASTALNPGGAGPTNGNGVGRGGTGVSHAGGGGMRGAAAGSMSFNNLDRGHKGYLTRSDVASDPQIASHFSQCDQNKDGKLSRTEFRACKRMNQ